MKQKKTNLITENLPPMYDHQRQAVNTTDISDAALIIRGAGSGKTRIGIEILKRNLKKDSYIVWLCPASLIAQAMGDFDEAGIPNYKFTSQDGEIVKGKVTIVSYDLLKRNIEKFTSLVWNLTISDEFHRTRNSGSIINDATWFLRKRSRKFYALTATPFNNTKKEFFEILSIIAGVDIVKRLERSISFKGKKGDLVFKLYSFFMKSLFGKETENKVSAKFTINRKNINKIMNSYIDYVEPEEYLSKIKRPKAKSKLEKVELSTEEVKYYKHVLKNKKIRNKEMHLRVFLLSKGSSKIDRAVRQVREILKTKNRRIIIFSNFVESGLGTLANELKKANIDFEIYKGNTDKKKRGTIKKKFLEGNLEVLLISPSGFEGLNLKGTTDCIVLDPHYNPAKTEQIISRGLRAGSNVEEVNIYHYCSVSNSLKKPTIDEKIMRVSGKKKDLNTAMEDLLKDIKRK